MKNKHMCLKHSSLSTYIQTLYTFSHSIFGMLKIKFRVFNVSLIFFSKNKFLLRSEIISSFSKKKYNVNHMKIIDKRCKQIWEERENERKTLNTFSRVHSKGKKKWNKGRRLEMFVLIFIPPKANCMNMFCFSHVESKNFSPALTLVE